MRLIDILQRFRGSIALALSLVAIERIAWVAEPSAFGPVIDAFVDLRSSAHAMLPLTPLLIWAGLYAVNSAVGALRRSADKRIYSRMMADIAADVTRISVLKQHSVSQTAGLVELSREYVDFVEFRMPELLEETISLLGAMVGLAFYDWRIAVACALVGLPIAGINRLVSHRVRALQSRVHTSAERSFETFESRDPEAVRRYYLERAEPERRIADWGARAFGTGRILLLALFVVMLYVAIDLDGFTTGTVFSIVAYLWTFIAAAELLPDLTQSWTSLQDLSGRLRASTEEPALGQNPG